MTSELNRREFVTALCLGIAALAVDPLNTFASPSGGIKPIRGSWFEFQHHATVEGVDWNPACARFTAEQWDAKVQEIADAGLEYLVLMATAVYYRSFTKRRSTRNGNWPALIRLKPYSRPPTSTK